ncbi:MAG: hypothetical protein ACI8SE_001705, partial [Bacteroidia bacterium]
KTPLQVPGIHKKTSSINDFKPITIINLTCYTFGSIVGSIIHPPCDLQSGLYKIHLVSGSLVFEYYPFHFHAFQ